MQVRAGTSGYAYKEWKGAFYPPKLAASEMLGHYSQRLQSVEINNTFYRMPKREVVRRWREQVPDSFRFVLKSSGRITHKKRLKDVAEELGYLDRASQELGPTRGPTLFQLPPYLRKDIERLKLFLHELRDGWPAAIEFRHESWHDPEVLDALRASNCAIVTSHGGSLEPQREATATFGYLRLRQPAYSSNELDGWEEYIRSQSWEEVYVFFKHEDDGTGPEVARAFAERFEDSAA